MFRTGSLFRRSAWIVLAVWFMATLAPGVSRAMAFVQGDIAPWSTVCSASDESPPESSDLLKHFGDHCQACTQQGDHLAPPAAPPNGLQTSMLGGAVPRLFLQAPRPLHAWATAQPRAPPILS